MSEDLTPVSQGEVKQVPVEGYEEVISELKSLFADFSVNAEEGKSGRGSKNKSLAARKLSMTITSKLKDFRTISIANDKAK